MPNQLLINHYGTLYFTYYIRSSVNYGDSRFGHETVNHNSKVQYFLGRNIVFYCRYDKHLTRLQGGEQNMTHFCGNLVVIAVPLVIINRSLYCISPEETERKDEY